MRFMISDTDGDVRPNHALQRTRHVARVCTFTRPVGRVGELGR